MASTAATPADSLSGVSDCNELADAITYLCEDLLTTAILFNLALSQGGALMSILLWSTCLCCCCYCLVCRSSFRRPVRQLPNNTHVSGGEMF